MRSFYLQFFFICEIICPHVMNTAIYRINFEFQMSSSSDQEIVHTWRHSLRFAGCKAVVLIFLNPTDPLNLNWSSRIPTLSQYVTNALILIQRAYKWSNTLLLWHPQTPKTLFTEPLGCMDLRLRNYDVKQRCPTHSPLATCGEWMLECGEWNFFEKMKS